MVDRAVPLVRRRLGEGDLLDVTNVGGAEKYLASPDGAPKAFASRLADPTNEATNSAVEAAVSPHLWGAHCLLAVVGRWSRKCGARTQNDEMLTSSRRITFADHGSRSSSILSLSKRARRFTRKRESEKACAV